MIANAIPYKDSGYTILEEGEISRTTYSFSLSHYLITDRQGETLPGKFPSLSEAEDAIQTILDQQANKGGG